MRKRTLFLIALVVVAAVQLYVPAKIILVREDVLTTGTEYKFKTAPIDPTDPFRGKYITLRFENTRVPIQREADWMDGVTGYAVLGVDADGFARVESVSLTEPNGVGNFLKVEDLYVTTDGSNMVTFQYPFDRYYMEESKAAGAERSYREAQSDTTKICYALVRVKDGESVLTDVLIDGRSIREIVKGQQGSKK